MHTTTQHPFVLKLGHIAAAHHLTLIHLEITQIWELRFCYDESVNNCWRIGKTTQPWNKKTNSWRIRKTSSWNKKTSISLAEGIWVLILVWRWFGLEMLVWITDWLFLYFLDCRLYCIVFYILFVVLNAPLGDNGAGGGDMWWSGWIPAFMSAEITHFLALLLFK